MNDLSERQRLIMEMVAKGLASKVIAMDIGISESAVKRHLTVIYKKLNTTRYQIIANANINKLKTALEFYVNGWTQEIVQEGKIKGIAWRPNFSLRDDHGTIARQALNGGKDNG